MLGILRNIFNKYSLILSIFFLIIGCSKKTNDSNLTYFGGIIINPKSKVVYLIKDDKVIDSTKLNKYNKFLFKFKNLNGGLYTFKHGVEFQYIFLQPNDSLLLRLNTWDFDESLVFSGKGAEKNNLLINLFLQNEKDDKEFYSYYQLDENDFQAKIKAALNRKYILLAQYKEEIATPSKDFNQLVNVAIKYPLYRIKENYPYFHKMEKKLNHFEKVSDSFYSFRKNLNLNDVNLVHFYPYYNYINSYLYHLAYVEKLKDKTNSNLNLNFFEAINKHIHQKNLKNYFLDRAIYTSFFYNNSKQDLETALTLFYNNCTNLKITESVKNLEADFKSIKKGSHLINFKLIDVNGKKNSVNDVVNGKNTVIYFWSQDLFNVDNLIKRINNLKKEYNSLLFVGINTQQSYNKWRTSTLLKRLNPNNQYQLTHKSNFKKHIKSSTPRIMLVDKNGIIKNGFTVFWAKDFNKQLLNLEKN